jgi:hypothetical protein
VELVPQRVGDLRILPHRRPQGWLARARAGPCTAQAGSPWRAVNPCCQGEPRVPAGTPPDLPLGRAPSPPHTRRARPLDFFFMI